MSLVDNTITFLGGSLAGYFAKYYLDLRFARRSQTITQKREVYEEIAKALGVFVSGRNSNINDKSRFLEYFSKLWLWASDSVVHAANELSDITIGLDSSDKRARRRLNVPFPTLCLRCEKTWDFQRLNLNQMNADLSLLGIRL